MNFVEDWFKSQDGTVYRRWSFDGGWTWEIHRTFYREIPTVKIDDPIGYAVQQIQEELESKEQS